LFASSGGVGEAPFVLIPNLSKWTYNMALFYEKDGISTRLSYNNRTAVNSNTFLPTTTFYDGEGVLQVGRLDFSFNYDIMKELTVTFDVANLLAKPFQNYRQYAPDRQYPRDVREEGRYFGVGARFRF
jgi:outer membrane receptor protein involved in Fe transport